ncbi:N-6 DNA methylase [Candidatus Woesearchaeota archaeon]|nr:N-6 DNA methylase [Candidatus Woesearchaeota archaeon]
MKAIATCIKGLEEITQLEIKEILKKKSEIIIPSRIAFNVKEDKELANFVYNTRSSIKVYKLINHDNFSDLDEILNKVKKIKFPKIKSPFVVRCERIGEHNFNSIDVEKEIGNIINKDNKLKVDLKNPTTILIIDIVSNKFFLGIDYTGIKLTKRNYRIKLLPNSINSALAYSMLRISEIKEKDTILDPICRSGEIMIEAALYLQKIANGLKLLDQLAFNKLLKFNPKNIIKTKKLKIYSIDSSQNSLKSAEINAKIANIYKNIIFSRYELEWLDTKLDKNSIDKIITFPQYPTNNLPTQEVEKIYKELFYQAEFIIKKNGIITILTPVPELIEKYANLRNFKKEKEYKINYMHQNFSILKLKNEICNKQKNI